MHSEVTDWLEDLQSLRHVKLRNSGNIFKLSTNNCIFSLFSYLLCSLNAKCMQTLFFFFFSVGATRLLHFFAPLQPYGFTFGALISTLSLVSFPHSQKLYFIPHWWAIWSHNSFQLNHLFWCYYSVFPTN